jgi:hypothetical protein
MLCIEHHLAVHRDVEAMNVLRLHSLYFVRTGYGEGRLDVPQPLLLADQARRLVDDYISYGWDPRRIDESTGTFLTT